jgi:uncharacterized protein with von Willebrand factor type A (vWA) domain
MKPAETPAPLMFEGLEAPLAPLDRLPRGLWLSSLVHSHGRLAPRLDGVEGLLGALAAGCLPGATAWPDAGLSRGIAATLEALDLPRYCAGKPALGESVLRSLLWHLDRIVDYADRGATEDEAAALALEAFAGDWKGRCQAMDQLAEAFGDFGDPRNTRWDELRGLLRSEGWQELVRIRRLLEDLPELARVIRGLGRARATGEPDPARPGDEPVTEQALLPLALERLSRVPDLPGETRGVTRSGRIARMLPSESVLLNHPRLRLVWHARHAERALLTYEDDDRLRELVPRPAPARRPSPEPAPGRRLEMGPMLVCVDTSGSMRGGAEAVAKAAVLEAARSALAQGRACHLFLFGGPDEVVDLEVVGLEKALEPDAVGRLTRFMGQAFRGGTDIGGPLERALARLAQESWRLADLLIASDGEFGATPELAREVAQAKAELGLRVEGILIGDRETIGFLELADHIHWVRDWRRYGSPEEGSEAGSPVHDKGLTAAYFPGALRTPANRAATVGGDRAAEAVRYGVRKEEEP